MKKSLINSPIFLRKFNYGTITFLRHFYQNIKMYHQQHQGQQYFLKNNNNGSNNSINSQDQQFKENDLRNFRKWISLQNATDKHGQIFTIFNYNILSQKLLEMHSYLYNRHDKTSLRWDQRLYNIIGEIYNSNPSILCFQVSDV